MTRQEDNTTDRIVFMPHFEQAQEHLDPLASIANALAFGVDDWGDSRAKAWIYGVVLGWGSDGGHVDDAHDEMAERYGWTPEQVDRLRALHQEWKRLEGAERERRAQ